MVIGVPNLASWQARFSGASWFHLDAPRHLFHFTTVTLAGVLQRAGLEPVEIHYMSWEHDPYGWVQSLLNIFGFEQNLVTRLLMHMRPVRSGAATIVANVFLASALVPLATALSLVSWVCRNGALMELHAQRQDPRTVDGASLKPPIPA